MSLHILLVFPEAQREQASAIKAVLKLLPLFKETGGEVETVKNVKAAWESLENQQYHYDLIIVHLHLAPDQQSPLDRAAQLGLAFLQDLSQKEWQPSSILVAPTKDDNLFQAVKLLPRCDLIFEGERLFDDLLDKAQECLKRVTYREPAALPVHTLEEHQKEEIFGNVDIWLNLQSQAYSAMYVPGHYEMYTYELGSRESTYIGSGGFFLNWKTLYDLAIKSRDLEDVDAYPWPRWQEELKAVGESLRCEICEGEQKFKSDFKNLLKEVKNKIHNTRIRFKLNVGTRDVKDSKKVKDPRDEYSEVLQAVVLEALLDDQKKFLMLHAPIFRRLDVSRLEDKDDEESQYRYPLFYKQARAEALNCLIIEADTSGIVSIEQKHGQVRENLKHLTHLGEESEGLQKFLQKRHKVLRLSKDRLPENLSFKDWVANILEEQGPWHLVHYAGHSLYTEDKTGYVFFPGENYAEPMNIADFSKLLRLAQARFLYLSSCQSSEDDFVFQLANRGIPAILGFRWEIDDDKAEKYALKFYEYLFKYRSLEQAFLEARTYAYRKYKKNRIWASPLLILQTP